MGMKRFPVFVNERPIRVIRKPMTYAAYSKDAIWGTGDSPIKARLDARQFLDWSRGEKYVTTETAKLKIAPMTDRLDEMVQKHGGTGVPFILNDGVLDVII